MKVLWLIKGLGPGGAEALLVSMAGLVQKHGVDLTCAYTVPEKNQLAKSLGEQGVEVLSLGRPGKPFFWSWNLSSLLRNRQFDIVHVHSPSIAATARVLVKALRIDTKIVYTEHNHWHAYNPATRLANRLTFSADDARIAVSSSVNQSLPPRHRASTTTVVHGIVLDKLQPSAGARDLIRGQLGVTKETLVILTVANLRRQKAYPDLMKAARAVLDIHPHVLFIAVGQGPLEQKLRVQIAHLGLERQFLLLGHRTDVPDVLAAADIFVLASVWEGYPIALMEAMASGLACIATRVGGATDAIDDGVSGLLLQPRDVPMLVRHLNTLIEEPEFRHDLASAAQSRAPYFDISRASTYMSTLYQELSR